ncbi:MAG TPA: restriction endonuclease [Pyrinomonadaceae bacterium]|nr:restriction endonuclease [Pyrinomonadaceae bacterium]
MARIDFKEIPQANLANGEQDTFELFARDFLEITGYEITTEPNRGSDGGRDFTVTEIRRGVGGTSRIPWLVSCKHHAHSGKSVSTTHEINILERVAQHNCSGFIGFYSSIASSGLSQQLEGLRTNRPDFDFQLFDGEKISTKLMSNPELGVLLEKYFPDSFQSFHLSNFGINLAMARFGKPYPVVFKHPTEEVELSVKEVINQFPEGNQYGFIPWTGEMFLFNNILGITKVMRRNELVDPTFAELEYLDRAIEFQIEHIRQDMEKDKELAKSKGE